MEKLIIQGGTKLEGEVTISGAKNAAVAILPATIITSGICKITNLPNISDVQNLYDILKELGAKIDILNEHEVIIDTRGITSHVAVSDKIAKLRASYYLIGALLAKFSNSEVGMPGGCNIGPRPIDQHIKGFEALGAQIMLENDRIKAISQGLVGTTIYLDVVSVGATINIMLAACTAKGKTIIENAAKEPHIVDLANFLNTFGADIKGAGTDVIKITGVDKLKSEETYSVVPDQIEAGTFMIAAAVSKGDVLIKNCIPKHMESLTAKLIEMGANIQELGDSIRVSCTKRLKSVNIKTQPYPGFPTDLQSQIGVAIAVSDGIGTINESIWDARFHYTTELNKMKANINVNGKIARFHGVEKLQGAVVEATDLRAGASLIIAGIIAEGTTTILNLQHIDRGYENIEAKFRNLNAKIERINE